MTYLRHTPHHRFTSLVLTLSCVALIFVLQATHPRDATAAPRTYRVGACLSAQDMPPPRKGESEMQYYQRTIDELKHIAAAIQPTALKGQMEVEYNLLSRAPTLPNPRACAQASKGKRDYDIWLELTYEENETFLFDVSQRDGQDLKLIATNPEPWPDAIQTRALLAEVGQRLVVGSSQPTAPTAKNLDASKGIIFIYDSSESMRETDPEKHNRLNVVPAIGELLVHTGASPIPFAMVVFSDSAKTLDDGSGSPWFQTTPAGFEAARVQLRPALEDIGNTNIGAAFQEAQRLMASRKDIDRWHVVFLTDGAPTTGIMDYGKITQVVTTALGGKSTLSVVALHGNDPLRTEEVKLAQLVRATMDGSNQSGEIINLKIGDDPKDLP